jgi:hypothetical protein
MHHHGVKTHVARFPGAGQDRRDWEGAAGYRVTAMMSAVTEPTTDTSGPRT